MNTENENKCAEQPMRDRTLGDEEKTELAGSVETVKKIIGGRKMYVCVRTFGCQQNEADSEKIAGLACEMGYTVTDDPDIASLIIVNTCAVREHAEKKALSVIGQFKHCKRKKTELIIGVCGCMVSQEHRAEELRDRYPYVDFSFGTSEIHLFPTLLARRLEGGKRCFLLPPSEPPVAENIPVYRNSGYQAWVSIMYGCNNFCSYCIVPYTRGRERSRRPEEIVKEVKELVEAGYKDITLLGQNVNSYGKNCSFDCNFAGLLKMIDAIPGDYLIRFMTSHPKDATRELIDVMAQSVHIAPQFHLPAQSGNNRVLKAMNRVYTRESYLDTVEYIREKIPGCVLSTDIIVGFPGETDDEFGDTMSLLGTVRYDMVYSFIYSPRKGTPAAGRGDQVPDDVKGERMKRLLDAQTLIADEKNSVYMGRTVRVLCYGESKNNGGMLECRTDGGKLVLVRGNAPEGQFLNVKITSTGAYALTGEQI